MSSFGDLLEIAKQAANGIYHDDTIGTCIFEVLEEGFENKQEVLDDLEHYDQCTIIPDASSNIIQQQNKTKYNWNEANDPPILYQILQKIFKENILNLATLINQFGKPIQTHTPSIPSSLLECTTTDLFNVSRIVAQTINKDAKKPIPIDQLELFITEQNMNGETLHQMDVKQFLDTIKKYKIKSGKGRQLFNGITAYWSQVKSTSLDSLPTTTTNHSVTQETQALILLLNHDIFPHKTFTTEQENALTSYITDTQTTGQQIADTTRKAFGQQVVSHFNNAKLNGPSMKLYSAITKALITPPSSLEECNHEYMMRIVDIFRQDDKRIQTYKKEIIAYFTENKIDGSMVKNTGRKAFAKGLSDHCGHKKINGAAFKLYDKINKFEFEDNDLSCDVIRRIARDLANKSLDKTHQKMQRAIKRHNVNGRMFMNKWNQSQYNGKNDKTFTAFFDEKICDEKGNTRFGIWFLHEIDAMDDKSILSKKNTTSFTKFVLDGYDEFISRIFAQKEMNETVFMQRGYQSIATEICKEYALPRGAITNLCRDIENYIKDEQLKANNYIRKRGKQRSMLWSIRPTHRTLEPIDIDDDHISGRILSPLSSLSEVKAIESMNECTVDQLVYVISDHVLNKEGAKLFKHKDAIVSYFVKEGVDGATLFAMKRPVFASNLLKHCAMKEKLKSATGKLYKTLAQFDVDKVNAFGVHLVQSETRVIWDNQITELNECNCDQIVYLLNQYILPKAANEDKLHLVHEHKDTLLLYFEKHRYVSNCTRKEFAEDMVRFASDNKKVKGAALKLWKLLHEFDFSLLIHSAVDDVKPTKFEDCSVEDMVYLIENNESVLPVKLKEYKAWIVEYFRDNKIDGKAWLVQERKTFTVDVSTYLKEKKTRGSLVKLYRALNQVFAVKQEEKSETQTDVKPITKEVKQVAAVPLNLEEIETDPVIPVMVMNDVSWKNKPTSIDECNTGQICFILSEYLLCSDAFKAKLGQCGADIVRFVIENELNGNKLKQMQRKVFGSELQTFTQQKGVLGPGVKLYTALVQFDLSQIPELKKLISAAAAAIPPPVKKAKRQQSSGLDRIEEHKDLEAPPALKASPRSPRSPLHRRSPSAPVTLCLVNGKPMQHRRHVTDLHVSIGKKQQSQRQKNEALAELPQDEFCRWVVQCVQKLAPSKTVQIMMNLIAKEKVSGKKLIQYILTANSSNERALEEFLQGTLECNEVYFLKYLNSKMISDYLNDRVPFENYGCDELAQYVRTQSHHHPADAFADKAIDGDTYCTKNSQYLLKFLRQSCGFRAGTARPLMASIDRYPTAETEQIKQQQTKYHYLQQHHMHPLQGVSYKKKVIHDDAASDASEANEFSLSVSVNPYMRGHAIGHAAGDDEAAVMFADHASKIYRRENERHWRRIRERLSKVGIENLLSNMNCKEEMKENTAFDKKYFVKQAKLVYKIEVNTFYEALYADIMNNALGFDDNMATKEAEKWCVEYELCKLHSVIITQRITRKDFEHKMLKKNDVFCKQYMHFLPRKRRNVLWKKLKKDIIKGKLNHM